MLHKSLCVVRVMVKCCKEVGHTQLIDHKNPTRYPLVSHVKRLHKNYVNEFVGALNQVLESNFYHEALVEKRNP